MYIQVIEYYYLKVNYRSMVNWCEHTDYLHCSLSFHGTPRYDCVIIKIKTSHIFGCFLLIFKLGAALQCILNFVDQKIHIGDVKISLLEEVAPESCQ